MHNQSKRNFKKHSAIIARLMLKLRWIEPKFFNKLYWESYRSSKNKRRKRNGWYNFNYYTELYYSTRDYWGECDEHSLINLVYDMLVDGEIIYNDVIDEYEYPKTWIKTTLSAIKKLRNELQHNKLQGTKPKQLRINRTHIPRQRSRKNKVLRLGKYHY